MFSTVESWWLFLIVISVINIMLWFTSLAVFKNRKKLFNRNILKSRQWVLWFSGVYVFVCAYRSFLPRNDLERICLVDHGLSSIFLGRSITTVAEILFIAQCAILLHEVGKGLNSRIAVTVSLLLCPLYLSLNFSHGMQC